MAALEPLLPWLEEGGRWKPSNCTARHRVAVVVPYRDRYVKTRLHTSFNVKLVLALSWQVKKFQNWVQRMSECIEMFVCNCADNFSFFQGRASSCFAAEPSPIVEAPTVGLWDIHSGAVWHRTFQQVKNILCFSKFKWEKYWNTVLNWNSFEAFSISSLFILILFTFEIFCENVVQTKKLRFDFKSSENVNIKFNIKRVDKN